MNQNVIIRRYEDRDREAVEAICIGTGEGPIPKDLLLNAFSRYYTENEAENCFVADADGTVAGYILCAPDAEKFSRKFRELYVKEGDSAAMFYETLADLVLPYKDSYPAHLHIDLSPEFQHQGIGTRLMDAEVQNLKRKHVKGLMLSVAADNEGGIRFYKKYGFAELDRNDREINMGLKLEN